MTPVQTALRRELAAIIARLHRLDLGKGADEAPSLGAASMYIKELSEKLAFVRNEVLAKCNAGENNREWRVKLRHQSLGC